MAKIKGLNSVEMKQRLNEIVMLFKVSMLHAFKRIYVDLGLNYNNRNEAI